MVPLQGGIWAEVKLVTIGTVERRKNKKLTDSQVVTKHLSYFARMTDAGTFATQASAEIRRRGVERATEVCAIQEWSGVATGLLVQELRPAQAIGAVPAAVQR